MFVSAMRMDNKHFVDKPKIEFTNVCGVEDKACFISDGLWLKWGGSLLRSDEKCLYKEIEGVALREFLGMIKIRNSNIKNNKDIKKTIGSEIFEIVKKASS